MPDFSQHPLPLHGARPSAVRVAATVRWPWVDDDLALGCECADPALQIERWGQEILPFPQSPSRAT